MPTPYLIYEALTKDLFQPDNEVLYISVLTLIATIFITNTALIIFAYGICKILAREAVNDMVR